MTYGCPWERTVGGEWTHVYVWLSSFAVHLKPPQHCKLAIPQYKMNFRVWITTTQVIFRMEKETATHSSVLAWIISGTGKPSGLLSMGSHGVGHDWSDLAAAAAATISLKALLLYHQLFLWITELLHLITLMFFPTYCCSLPSFLL